MGVSTNRWTAEEDAELARLAPDHSAREIADRLGRPRNSVIGRAFRKKLRICGGVTPGKVVRIGKVAGVSPTDTGPDRPRRSLVAGAAAAAAAEGMARRLAARPQVDAAPAFVSLAVEPVPFLRLRAGRCKFPVWPHGTRPALDAMMFCGDAAGPGQSYCPACKARTLAPPQQRRAG